MGIEMEKITINRNGLAKKGGKNKKILETYLSRAARDHGGRRGIYVQKPKGKGERLRNLFSRCRVKFSSIFCFHISVLSVSSVAKQFQKILVLADISRMC